MIRACRRVLAVLQLRQDVIQAAPRYHEASGHIGHRQKTLFGHFTTLPRASGLRATSPVPLPRPDLGHALLIA